MGAVEHNPAAEIDRFSQGLRDSDLAFDLNSDGVVDLDDLTFLVEKQLSTSIGDANLDGSFDSSDFVAVFQVGQYEDGLPLNSSWSTGDWNCDREFDSSDFLFAFQAGGYEATASPAALLAATLVDIGTLGTGQRAQRTMPTLGGQSGPAGPARVGVLRALAKTMARPSAAALRWAHDPLFATAQRERFFADLDGRVERAVASLLGSPSAEDDPFSVAVPLVASHRSFNRVGNAPRV